MQDRGRNQPTASQDIRQYVLALDCLHEAVTIAGTDNQIVYANAVCEQIYGYAETELIGQWDVTFFPPGERWVDDNVALASRGDKWEGEVTGISKEGRDLALKLTITLIRNEHREVTGRIVVHREITEDVRAKAAEARVESENKRL